MKNSKGSVSIINSNGRLQLRWRVQGRRFYLSLGLTDTTVNRKLAKAKAGIIESDIVYERFDQTLDRYKPPTLTPITPRPLTLTEIWEKYLEHKSPQLGHNTILWQMGNVTSHLAKCPHNSIGEHSAIISWLVANHSLDATRRTVMQINAALEWALNEGLVDSNPFEGWQKKVGKIQKENDIDPFTPSETQAILKSFEGTRFYPIIAFLFLTGARTGEARGLAWGDVAVDCSHLIIRQSLSGNVFTDTKNHKPRQFPCGTQLCSLLTSLKPLKVDPSDLVFSNIGRKALWYQWNKRVNELVENGKVNRYRCQYQTRHTFITRCLEAGVPIPQIAKWVGNSPATLLKHYAGVIQHHQPPEL